MAQQRITKDQATTAIRLLDNAVAQLSINRDGHQRLQAASVVLNQYIEESETFRLGIVTSDDEKVGLTD